LSRSYSNRVECNRAEWGTAMAESVRLRQRFEDYSAALRL
jgi:hypothetical protein